LFLPSFDQARVTQPNTRSTDIHPTRESGPHPVRGWTEPETQIAQAPAA
jgi:hypothetical protein